MKRCVLFALAVTAAVSSVAESQKWLSELQDGDLLFQASQSQFSEAIVAATARNTINFSHVGIYALLGGKKSVIEASPREGVTVTPLENFTEGCIVKAMRVDIPGGDSIRVKAVGEALRLVGRPYDLRFAPGDSAVYCSELVQLAYNRASGQEVFRSAPMNFMAADGTLPQFWIEIFEKEGVPIPQGEPGTNPVAMFLSPELEPIE